MTARHEILGGKVTLYKRDGRFWQCAASVGGKQYRATTKKEELSQAEDAAEDWYLELRGKFKRGDLEAGFKAADYVIEREFNTAMVHQGYIEPHNAVGIYNSDGQATIYCSTQGAFDVRSLSAQVLGMPVGHIKVVPAEIGGGFGGKTTIYLEPLALLLAQKRGRPV